MPRKMLLLDLFSFQNVFGARPMSLVATSILPRGQVSVHALWADVAVVF